MESEKSTLATSAEYNKKLYTQKYISDETDYCHSAVKLMVSDDGEPDGGEIRTWIGLSSQELKPFAEDPFWVRMRMGCLYAAWATFTFLLASVVIVIVRAPRCHGLEWWQKGPIYNVLAPSFEDTDASGLGDIRGIESKLDYVASLGVKVVWISPIYKSPMKDFGYDIEDFKDVDETFGSLDDFKRLVAAMKQRDLKLVMDFVPNHSSDQHAWFKKSVDRVTPYADYYVWAPPKAFKNGVPQPPNNWVSVFGGSAWEWNEHRKEYYLHQFAKEQPDLNFRNRKVVDEMIEVLQFWLDLGVDGFRIDSVGHLFEDINLADEPKSDSNANPNEYSSLKHIHTHNLAEGLGVIAEFRKLLDDYADRTDQVKRLMMVEIYESIKETVRYYGDDDAPLADFPFNFLLMTHLKRNSSATDVKSTIDTWMRGLPANKWPNWVLGNHDQSRAATRFSPDMVDALNMILLLLPGTPVTYYGEEIGMEDTKISWNNTVDPAGRNAGRDNYEKHSRDPERTPMQWSDAKNAGFSEANQTWLPINPNYKTVNVEAQMTGESHLEVYKTLVRLRQEPSLMFGSLETKVINGTVFAFTRLRLGSLGYVVAVNWGEESKKVDLTEFSGISDKAQVITKSINFKAGDMKYIEPNDVQLAPKEGIVLMFTPDFTQKINETNK